MWPWPWCRRRIYLNLEELEKFTSINNNEFEIENTLVVSRGYGEKEGEEQKTLSTSAFFFKRFPAKGNMLIEPIDANVLHLNNEYWVSYYTSGSQIYDKRFGFFVPRYDSAKRILVFYQGTGRKEGVLHSWACLNPLNLWWSFFGVGLLEFFDKPFIGFQASRKTNPCQVYMGDISFHGLLNDKQGYEISSSWNWIPIDFMKIEGRLIARHGHHEIIV